MNINVFSKYISFILIVWFLSGYCLSLDQPKPLEDDVQLTRHHPNGEITYVSQIVENNAGEIFPSYCCSMSKNLNVTATRVIGKKHVQQSVPVFFFSRRDCTSTGNMLGMYYESLTFALSRQMAMALIANVHCKYQPTLLSYLPTIIYPPFSSPLSLQSSVLSSRNAWMESRYHDHNFCQTLPNYPWENKEHNVMLFHNINQISQINHQMVANFIANQFAAVKDDIMLSMKDTLAIHFRCRDNFVIAMGIIPFSIYLRHVQQILADFKTNYNYEFASITIISDAMPDGYPGNTCWRLIGELRKLLSSSIAAHSSDDDKITIKDVYTSPYVAYAMLHSAKVVICSISTFCFFAVLEEDQNNLAPRERREVYFVNESSVAVVQVPAFFFDENHMQTQGWIKKWKGIRGVKGVSLTGNNKSDAQEWKRVFHTIVHS